MKKLLLLTVPIVLAICILGYNKIFNGENNKLSVVEKDSYYSDFLVSDDMVEIECHITIKNDNDTNKTVNISTLMPADVTGGLLKESPIYALDESGNKIDFLIEKESEKSFEVTFIGEYGGTNKKQNKLLPEIVLEVVE